ncbi:MAG: hypothetical protein V2I76_03230 [Roseobacter sp.]|jgi:quercetin dioxygenase-like cupin family protein|nr:hypothetical protein [Roseobacter sp.]
MKRISAFTTALAIGLSASPVVGYDFGDMKTRVIHGLEGPSKARSISNAVHGNAPLATEGIATLTGRNLRTRFWTIPENGIVPIHDHANRPAVFTILSGEIYEYTSTSPDRVLHKTGGLALEEGALAHWWLNEGAETVHLIAFDVFAPGKNAVREVSGRPQAAKLAAPADHKAEHLFLGAVDIGGHFDDGTGEGLGLTTYRTTIEPGGSFADFTTAGEPLQVFVWQGEVLKHSSDGQDVLAAHTGDSLATGETAWWENTSDTPAVLYFGVVEPLSEVAGLKAHGIIAHGYAE